jgi:hypothetical protein
MQLRTILLVLLPSDTFSTKSSLEKLIIILTSNFNISVIYYINRLVELVD